jgi:hypothetical protein
MLMIFCELYLDDLIIFAKSVDELIENFRRILERFREFNSSSTLRSVNWV